MRRQDLKVQAIARKVGMLYLHNGIEYSQPVTIGEFTMEFQFETPDEVAYIEVYKEGKRRPVSSYTEDFEDVKIDYPQFFKN